MQEHKAHTAEERRHRSRHDHEALYVSYTLTSLRAKRTAYFLDPNDLLSAPNSWPLSCQETYRSIPRPMLYSSSSPTSSSVLFAKAKGCSGARQYCCQLGKCLATNLVVLRDVRDELQMDVGLSAEERDGERRDAQEDHDACWLARLRVRMPTFRHAGMLESYASAMLALATEGKLTRHDRRDDEERRESGRRSREIVQRDDHKDVIGDIGHVRIPPLHRNCNFQCETRRDHARMHMQSIMPSDPNATNNTTTLAAAPRSGPCPAMSAHSTKERVSPYYS